MGAWADQAEGVVWTLAEFGNRVVEECAGLTDFGISERLQQSLNAAVLHLLPLWEKVARSAG